MVYVSSTTRRNFGSKFPSIVGECIHCVMQWWNHSLVTSGSLNGGIIPWSREMSGDTLPSGREESVSSLNICCLLSKLRSSSLVESGRLVLSQKGITKASEPKFSKNEGQRWLDLSSSMQKDFSINETSCLVKIFKKDQTTKLDSLHLPTLNPGQRRPIFSFNLFQCQKHSTIHGNFRGRKEELPTLR